MYRISKEFTFEAAHQLKGLPDGHQCGRMHGHSYRVIVTLESDTLNEHSFIVDYGELSLLKIYIDLELDHQILNEVLPLEQPSAENLAKYFYEVAKGNWPEVAEVAVSETQKTWATYRP